jgi:3-hydroxyisobutyrate dehydrogenase
MSHVAVLGLGTMGAPIAGHLATAGHEVRAWNRSAMRPAPAGATRIATLAEALTGADAVVLSVSDTPDVEALILGTHGTPGAIDLLAPGAIVIDTSTISPSATRTMGERLAEKGILMVDAPVSGGSEGAQKGTLTVFLGGSDAAVAAAHPYLTTFGKTITHLGPLGAGQVGKAVNQLVISGTYLSVAEGMLVGQKAGLDPATLAAALGGGAARSWVLENRWERMANDTYPLGFRVALHRKDLGIAIDLADELNVAVPAAMLVATLEDDLIASGHGDEDLSALARRLRELADTMDPHD